MENRWGANRIVFVKLTSGLIETGKRMREIQKEVQGGGRGAATSSRGSGNIFVIGPVDDFNRFVQLIDFGTVTRTDESTRTVEVNVTPNYKHTPR